MSVDQLVECFLAIALDQDRAIFAGDHARYNRLYEKMDAVKEELKSRPADQRRALIPLHTHPNAQVRLKSAIATLTLAPEAARRTLQIIRDRKEYPQAADALGMLRALEHGTFTPS
jgi:hypothetical protein